MSHPFPGPDANDAFDESLPPWRATADWTPTPAAWTPPRRPAFDDWRTMAHDVSVHQRAWHDALGTPIRTEWVTPLGGPSAAVLQHQVQEATRRLTLWHRAGPSAVAAAHALRTRWPETVPGWLECSDAELPLAVLLHRLLTVYAPHQVHVRVPTVGGSTGTRALMDLVRECCNPRGAPTSTVDCEGRPIRHGDMLLHDADSLAMFVRGQRDPYLAIVAEDAADGEWIDRQTVATMTLGWTRTPPGVVRPLPQSVAIHHPAVPYALIVCVGRPRALDVLPDALEDA